MSSKKIKSGHFALRKILLAYLGLNLLLYVISIILTEGKYAYSLDDSYIHLSIADNLANRGLFSVTGRDFEAASSSIFYSLLLTVIRLLITDFDLYVLSPIAINHVFNLLIIKFFYDRCKELQISESRSIIISLLSVVLIPTINNPFIGMEHAIQTYLALQLLNTSIAQITTNDGKHWPISLYLLAFLSTGFRYEAFFLIAPIVFLFLFNRKYLIAIGIAAASLIPNVWFAIYSSQHGGMIIPNSILIKTINKQYLASDSPIMDAIFLIGNLIWNMISGFPLVYGIVIVVMLVFNQIPIEEANKSPLIGRLLKMLEAISKDEWLSACFIFSIASIGHVLTARMLWFFRYESYLLAILYYLGIVFAMRLNYFDRLYEYFQVKFFSLFRITQAKNKMQDQEKKQDSGALEVNTNDKFYKLFAVLFVILLVRGLICIVQIPLASRNIYQQQYMMGQFVSKYYNNRSVAANDIGAINLFNDAYILDLVGLSNTEVAEFRMNRNYTTSTLEYLMEKYNISIAIIYEYWFSGTYDFLPRRPDSWIKVGEWTINLRVISDRETVSFWAIHPEDVRELKANLVDFESSLPQEVKVAYFI